jgi:hypothetical protein
MTTPKVNSWRGWRNFTVNISPMLKPCSSSSKPSMDIIVALHCLNLALDHTWENIMLSKFNSLKFHNVLSFIPTEGRLLIKLIPQVITCSQSLNRSQKFWNKDRDEKRAKPCSQIWINLHIAHELSSHLVSQAYLFYSFPSHNIYMW